MPKTMLMNHIVLLFLFSLSTLFAQEHPYFEGTISYKIEMKGEMVPQLQLNEPPNEMIMHVKDGSYIVNLKGGRYAKTFVFVSDSNRQYSVDFNNRMAYRYYPHNDIAQKDKEKLAASYTGKEVELNGHTVKIYQAKQGDTRFTYYVRDNLKVDISNYPSDTRARANFLVEGLEGKIPVKTIKQQKGLTVITSATRITARPFKEAQFRIPPGFTVKNRDYRW
ncbi:MAG: hypothetical protein AAF388_15795 [Bacteroidota bacterium]